MDVGPLTSSDMTLLLESSACTVIVIEAIFAGSRLALRSLAHVSERKGVGIGDLCKVGRVFVVEIRRVRAERLQKAEALRRSCRSIPVLAWTRSKWFPGIRVRLRTSDKAVVKARENIANRRPR